MNGPDGRFTPISLQSNSESSICVDNSLKNHQQNLTADKWKSFSERLLKNGIWEKLSRVLNKVPKEIARIYDGVESISQTETKLDEGPRHKIYREFFRIASTNFGELHLWEVEGLVLSDIISSTIGIQDLSPLKKKRIMKEARKKNSKGVSLDENEVYDFELFVTLIYSIMSLKQNFVSKKNVDLRKLLQSYLPIDPDLPAKQAWDMFIMLLLLYCSFDVPYSLAFPIDTVGLTWTSYEVWGLCVDGFFFLDIALTFITAMDEGGALITSFRLIASRYLGGWFFVDVAGTFPTDYVLQAVVSATMNGGAALQILRVLKLVKMVRLLKTAKFFAQLNQLSRSQRFAAFANIISVFKAVFLLAFISHTMGCAFAMMLQLDLDENWLSNYRGGELIDSDEYSRYVVSLYWATISLTTMGYGDVVPANTSERLFCTFVALLGGCVFSYCVGSISSIISSIKGTDHIYRSRVQVVGEYLDFRGVSLSLKRRVRAHYAHSWIRSGAPFEEDSILRDLTPSLRASLLREVGALAQRDVPLLEGLDEECAGHILTRLSHASFRPGELIYARGDPASQMFLVAHGAVALFHGQSHLRSASHERC